MNNNFFKIHRSQIETVSVIVHTPMTSLFKGAQLMKYAVWVLILLCCAATNCPVRQCFYALFTLRCKIETSLGVFLQLVFTQMEEKKISIACFSFRLCWKKVNLFYVCSICFRNLLVKLKNVKQKAGFRWKCVLKSMFILSFTRINNEQSSIVSKISTNLGTHVTIYLIHKVGRDLVFK